jgi:hypothetical protein
MAHPPFMRAVVAAKHLVGAHSHRHQENVLTLPASFEPKDNFEPYQRIPHSIFRVKLSFRIDFTNGGHVEGEGFLLDVPDGSVAAERAAEMLVSAMNLLRAGVVTIRSLEIVRRGEHDDSPS